MEQPLLKVCACQDYSCWGKVADFLYFFLFFCLCVKGEKREHSSAFADKIQISAADWLLQYRSLNHRVHQVDNLQMFPVTSMHSNDVFDYVSSPKLTHPPHPSQTLTESEHWESERERDRQIYKYSPRQCVHIFSFFSTTFFFSPSVKRVKIETNEGLHSFCSEMTCW